MNNIVFNYTKKDIIGLINSVDTGMSTAVINDDSTLSQLQVNQLLAVQSPKSGRFIIAMIIKMVTIYDITLKSMTTIANKGVTHN